MAVPIRTLLPYPRCLPSRRQELHDALFNSAAPNVDASRDVHLIEVSPHQEAECAQHDGYFGVERVATPAALLNSIRDINAQIEAHMATDQSVIDDPGTKQTLFGAESILRILTDSDLASARSWPRISDITRPESYGGECTDPQEHWRLGHRMFFTLIQSIIIALTCFKSDWNEGSTLDATCDLVAAALLCRSSGVAMTYAAAFNADFYEQQIRPTMLPPTVNEGFSGLQTRDHRMLIETMKSIGPELTEAAACPEAWTGIEEFRNALEDMYRAHGYVCTHFGGGSNPSLRMEARAAGRSDRPGIQVVEEMKKARLSMIPNPTRPIPSKKFTAT